MKLLKNLIRFSPLVFPAYFFRFQVVGIPLTALEIFCYLLFSLWAILLVTKKVKFKWDKKNQPYYLAVLLIFLGATIGMALAPETMPGPQGAIVQSRRIAMGIWKGWVVAPMLYFWVISQLVETKKQVRDLLLSFTYSCLIVSLISFAWATWGDGLTYDGRLNGFYESANYLALYLIPGLLAGSTIVAKSVLLQGKFAKDNLTHTVGLLIITVAVLMTQSYAGILAIFGSVFLYLVYLLIQKPQRRQKVLKGIISFGVLLILILISQWNTPKFQQFIDFENRSSSSVRIELYEASWGLLKQHPIKGLGPGLFQAHYHDQVHPILGHFPMEWNLPHPHNIFLGFWFESGLIGLIGFLWLLLLMHRKFTYPLIAMWGLLLHGLFDMPFWKNDLAMIFWVVLVCIMVLQHQEIGSRK